MGAKPKRSLAEQLARLPRLDRQQLADLWRELYNIEPPHKIGAEFLRMACAYRLQECAHGGLKPSTHRYLLKVVEEMAAGKAGITPPLVIKPGTRLIREWHGVTYEVIVIPGGGVAQWGAVKITDGGSAPNHRCQMVWPPVLRIAQRRAQP